MSERILTRNQVQMVAWTAVAAVLGAVWVAKSSQSNQTCRCFPGDACWPSSAEWDSFNNTLGGKLIATVPIASPCHDDFPGVSYDAEECAYIQDNWVVPTLHDKTTHSTMAGYFANMSCDPFTGRDAQCVVGSYVQYAVNASGSADYASAIAFAQKHDIRLVIRNTGHDYLGKSSGAGALAIWTHNIKDKTIIDYESEAYTGKAIRLGAGVQAGEAQAFANTEGYVVVEGDCPTVGIVGGYTQGGGTSPLGSKFGLGVDQVLEWEVVTANGQLLTATPTENEDLYWALTGGGGGTYGVVLSMTVKLHPNMATAGAVLQFTDASDAFWDVITVFLMNLPAILNAGGTAYWQVIPGNTFILPQTYLPNGTAQQLAKLLQPTIVALNQSGIAYSFSTGDYPTFQDAFYTMNPEMNITEMNIGGRIIPSSLVASTTSATSLADAIHYMLDNGGIFAGVSMNVEKPPTSPNSVNPQWRDSVFLAFYGTVYDMYNMTANVVGQATVTNVLSPALEALTPGGAAYLNEADRNQPNWQKVFYGANYARLLQIKQKYDPTGTFWGQTAVGSEGWEIAPDWRLCKTQ